MFLGPWGLSSGHLGPCSLCHVERGCSSPAAPPQVPSPANPKRGLSQKAGQPPILRSPPSSGAPAQLQGPALRPGWPTGPLNSDPKSQGAHCRCPIFKPRGTWSGLQSRRPGAGPGPESPGPGLSSPGVSSASPGLLSGEDVIISE